MYPKKAKDIIAEYARDKDIPQEHIEYIVQGYWKAIREKTSAMEYWNYRIRGLGDLRVSYGKVRDSFYSNLQQKVDNKHDTDSYLYASAKKNMKMLANMLKVFRVEWKKKDKVRWEKHKYLTEHSIPPRKNKNGLARKTKPGMGEQGQDC